MRLVGITPTVPPTHPRIRLSLRLTERFKCQSIDRRPDGVDLTDYSDTNKEEEEAEEEKKGEISNTCSR